MHFIHTTLIAICRWDSGSRFITEVKERCTLMADRWGIPGAVLSYQQTLCHCERLIDTSSSCTIKMERSSYSLRPTKDFHKLILRLDTRDDFPHGFVVRVICTGSYYTRLIN